MLTKSDRATIVERLRGWNNVSYYGFYKAVIGTVTTTDTPFEEDISELSKIILDLCDTSNMLELPLDKDGEVIRVEDTVFNTDGEKLSVTSIRFSAGLDCIVICENDDSISTYAGKELTHNSLITTVYFAEKIREILKDDDDMNTWTNSRLSDIADQLEQLGGNNE